MFYLICKKYKKKQKNDNKKSKTNNNNLSYSNLFADKVTNAASNQYYGTYIGRLSELHHGVSGEVYAVDSRTLFLKNFKYDGDAPGKSSN